LPAIPTSAARSRHRRRVTARRLIDVASACRKSCDVALLTKADQKKKFERKLWSALQTHLQGVNRATLAIVPEKTNGHCAALLSRSSKQPN
jgi:hypothetical protein